LGIAIKKEFEVVLVSSQELELVVSQELEYVVAQELELRETGVEEPMEPNVLQGVVPKMDVDQRLVTFWGGGEAGEGEEGIMPPVPPGPSP